MNAVLALALIIGLPIAAAKGKLYRGAWAGIAFISLLLALGFSMVPTADLDAGGEEVKQWLVGAFFSNSFACLLAVFFYRKPKPVSPVE